MPGLHLSIATTDYDHFRDFRLGLVTAEGIEHFCLTLGHHECFARFTANREFDLAELSFAKFMTQVSRDDSDIIGLPVVCSRLFRFSSFYVNKKSGITKIEDLKGKKVGSPEWDTSAAVHMGGWVWRDARRGAVASRGCEHPWAQREGRADTAEGRDDHARLGPKPQRHACRARDRLRDHRTAAPLFYRRASRRRAAVSGLRADGRGVLPPHESLADHAHHRDASRDHRRVSMGGAQSLQRVPRIEATFGRARP